MIEIKILFLEQELVKYPLKNKELLEGLVSIKNLLAQVDLNAEVIPLDYLKKVRILFQSLKQEPLTKSEIKAIRAILKF